MDKKKLPAKMDKKRFWQIRSPTISSYNCKKGYQTPNTKKTSLATEKKVDQSIDFHPGKWEILLIEVQQVQSQMY